MNIAHSSRNYLTYGIQENNQNIVVFISSEITQQLKIIIRMICLPIYSFFGMLFSFSNVYLILLCFKQVMFSTGGL